jgi:ribonuclease HI
MKSVTIYSDGACEGNPGPGGWAVILQYGEIQKEFSGGELATTNNRMELTAAIEGLQRLKEPCEVQFHTDSEYVRNGITAWIFGWKKKNWKKDGKPIKNIDLWQELDRAAARHKVTWNWVRGHAGDPLNEKCDRLAVAEIQKLRQQNSKDALSKALQEFKSRQEGQGAVSPPQNALFPPMQNQ